MSGLRPFNGKGNPDQATVSAIAIRTNVRATKPPAIHDMLRTHCLSDCLLMWSSHGLIRLQGSISVEQRGFPGQRHSNTLQSGLDTEYPNEWLGFTRWLVATHFLAGGGWRLQLFNPLGLHGILTPFRTLTDCECGDGGRFAGYPWGQHSAVVNSKERCRDADGFSVARVSQRFSSRAASNRR